MNNKLLDFLNTIGIDEDYIDYFKESTIEKVIINKNTNRFQFIFNIDKVLPIKVYNNLNSSKLVLRHFNLNLD